MTTNVAPPTSYLSCDQALKIARGDAEKVYRDLTRYHIRLALEADGWHVNYELKDPRCYSLWKIQGSCPLFGQPLRGTRGKGSGDRSGNP